MKSLKKWKVFNKVTGEVFNSYRLKATAFDTANGLNMHLVFAGKPALFVVSYIHD